MGRVGGAAASFPTKSPETFVGERPNAQSLGQQGRRRGR